MDVAYVRYQDDLIVLCKTKRQLNRCRRKMMNILYERHLTLSRKKSRIGSIEKPFHFLGIDYPGTQPLEDTTVVLEDFPHARTIRKAREQVKVNWVSAQKDHGLFEKLGTVVDQNNSKHLGLPNTFISVY